MSPSAAQPVVLLAAGEGIEPLQRHALFPQSVHCHARPWPKREREPDARSQGHDARCSQPTCCTIATGSVLPDGVYLHSSSLCVLMWGRSLPMRHARSDVDLAPPPALAVPEGMEVVDLLGRKQAARAEKCCIASALPRTALMIRTVRNSHRSSGRAVRLWMCCARPITCPCRVSPSNNGPRRSVFMMFAVQQRRQL